MDRREFISISIAAAVLVALPGHQHTYTSAWYKDAFHCSCGHTVTGLKLFQMPSAMRERVVRGRNDNS